MTRSGSNDSPFSAILLKSGCSPSRPCLQTEGPCASVLLEPHLPTQRGPFPAPTGGGSSDPIPSVFEKIESGRDQSNADEREQPQCPEFEQRPAKQQTAESGECHERLRVTNRCTTVRAVVLVQRGRFPTGATHDLTPSGRLLALVAFAAHCTAVRWRPKKTFVKCPRPLWEPHEGTPGINKKRHGRVFGVSRRRSTSGGCTGRPWASRHGDLSVTRSDTVVS